MQILYQNDYRAIMSENCHPRLTLLQNLEDFNPHFGSHLRCLGARLYALMQCCALHTAAILAAAHSVAPSFALTRYASLSDLRLELVGVFANWF